MKGDKIKFCILGAPIVLVGWDAQVTRSKLPGGLLNLELYCNKEVMRSAPATKGYEKDYVARIADASNAGKNCINVLRAVESLLLGKKKVLMMVLLDP